MIDIRDHGGKFGGGGGFLFRGDQHVVTFKEEIKEGDLVRVGIELESLPWPEGVSSNITSSFFSPDGKYAILKGSNWADLFERVYVNGSVEYRKLPRPTGFPSYGDVVSVTFNNKSNLFIIFSGGSTPTEIGTFQLLNEQWSKIDFSFTGKSYLGDGVFSPDDKFLVLQSGTSSGFIDGITVIRVHEIEGQPTTFSSHYPHNRISPYYRERPFFLSDIKFSSPYLNSQYLCTITDGGLTISSSSLTERGDTRVYLDGGNYLLMAYGSPGVIRLYKKNMNDIYEEIIDAYDNAIPYDLSPSLRSYTELFSITNQGQIFIFLNYYRGMKLKFVKEEEKLVRVFSFNPYNKDSLTFPVGAQKMVNSFDRVYLGGRGKLELEKDVAFKLSHDSQYNYDYVGIAKQNGFAGEKRKVLKVTS